MSSIIRDDKSALLNRSANPDQITFNVVMISKACILKVELLRVYAK